MLRFNVGNKRALTGKYTGIAGCYGGYIPLLALLCSALIPALKCSKNLFCSLIYLNGIRKFASHSGPAIIFWMGGEY